MHISRKSDYALRAMTYISAWPNNKICSINEISKGEQVPREYLAKILKKLSLEGFLVSYKGVNGGYRLARPREKVTFLDVIEAMEGEIAVNDCVRRGPESACLRKAGCAMHSFWKAEQERVERSLSSINLASLDYQKYYPEAQRGSKGKQTASVL